MREGAGCPLSPMSAIKKLRGIEGNTAVHAINTETQNLIMLRFFIMGLFFYF
jgi:hypothetical protein